MTVPQTIDPTETIDSPRPRFSRTKSHLLAYIKHEPGFAHRITEFQAIPISRILEQVYIQNPEAHLKCLERLTSTGHNLPNHQ